MPKAYEASKVEKHWYDYWMEQGYFVAKIEKDKVPFTIMMPPPNITGELHLGHALTATLEDIMTRWHRMKGDPTLWLPGTDHAGIAAQMVVERELGKAGINRHQIGREAFLERMGAWATKYRQRITEQHKRLGVSCDWSREQFTLNEDLVLAVRTTFKNLYDDGLVYRSERITNWCPRCQTVLSDLEVEHKEDKGHLWHIKYPLVGSSQFVVVATTRPETMLGDTAVAVNLSDNRYKALIGQKVVLPLIGRQIPIVGDEAIDMAFGTGAVKTTPGHDPVDFEIGTRHGLPIINILNKDATINENGGVFQGLTADKARLAVVEALSQQGFLLNVEDHLHSVGHCHRCATVVEPTVSLQWFVNVVPLARPAINAVKEGKITIIPEHFSKVYLNWMENIRDWCISRQLWWGHRIPVWYCNNCSELTVSVEIPQACQKCHGTDIYQDQDVLDTWFSSGLWPHSTLGWPKKTADLEYFYPTSVLETAYDILFFWVARMIMQGIYNMGDVPFKVVYLHGLIRDEKGEKMSKSKGNVLDPLKLADQYGADALRFALIYGSSPGNDSKLTIIKLENGRNFANKIYNAARFVISNIPSLPIQLLKTESLNLEDRWILSRLNSVVAETNRMLESFQFGEAARILHDFVWGQFCDWYIEMSKTRLNSDNSPSAVLTHVLEKSLRLLHPFMPFVTEELWQSLKEALPAGVISDLSIMVSSYPESEERFIDTQAEKNAEIMLEIVRAIRNARASNNLPAKELLQVEIYSLQYYSGLTDYQEIIKRLAKCGEIRIVALDSRKDHSNELHIPIAGAEIFILLGDLADKEAESGRKAKERAELEKLVEALRNRLSDPEFRSKAPTHVITKEEERLAEFLDRLSRL